MLQIHFTTAFREFVFPAEADEGAHQRDRRDHRDTSAGNTQGLKIIDSLKKQKPH